MTRERRQDEFHQKFSRELTFITSEKKEKKNNLEQSVIATFSYVEVTLSIFAYLLNDSQGNVTNLLFVREVFRFL